MHAIVVKRGVSFGIHSFCVRRRGFEILIVSNQMGKVGSTVVGLYEFARFTQGVAIFEC